MINMNPDNCETTMSVDSLTPSAAQVVESARSASEALGLELGNIRLTKLGAKSMRVVFEINDITGVNE